MNKIELAKEYLPVIDAIYQKESMTAALLPANADIKFNGVGEVSVFEIDMDGFGDYSRADGYPIGAVSSGWTNYKLEQDRGISLPVDALDNEESLRMVFKNLVPEFIRTKEIPELDALNLRAAA